MRGNLEIRRPVESRAIVEPARVVSGDQVVDRRRALFRRLAALQRQKTAHVDDSVDVLDHHRALFDAGATRRAGP